MALVTINGVAVIQGNIIRPLTGVWTADLVIDRPDGAGFEPGARVTIASENGYELKGVVAPNRTGDFLDAVHVRVLGGAGGMAKVARPRSYVQPAAYCSDVVNGLMKDAGETLSGTASQDFLRTNLTAWSVFATPVARALETLLDMAGTGIGWRVLADGAVWIGSETWPTASVDFDLLGESPEDASVLCGIESPSFEPGTTVEGIGRIARVENSIGEGKIRARLWTDAGDRGIAAALKSMVDHATAWVDYFGLYECKVVSQSSDLLTVDVSPLPPVDARLGGLQRVEVRAGTGIKVKFSSGAKVLLGWKGGDPQKPYVLPGLSAEAFDRLQLGGDVDAARKDDHVDCGTLALTITVTGPTAGQLGGTYTDPDGTPVTIPNSASISVSLKGKISEGSSKVGLG